MTAAAPPPVRRIDSSPLLEPVDETRLDAFVAESKSAGRPWARMTTGLPRPGVGDVISDLLPVVIPLVGLTALFLAGGRSLVRALWEVSTEAPLPYNLIPAGFLGLILIGVFVGLGRVVRLIARLRVPRWWWEAAYRLTRFAAANALRYGHDEPVSHPGVIFAAGTDRIAERRLSTTSGRRVEIANYRYVQTGENREDTRVYGWGYVAIGLDRRLPHLLLDAKANNSSVFGIKTSNLPVDLAPDQRLSLGGEFDQHFTLYAPSNYGRDAFGIFTPDLMALFIDRLGTFDVEIVDDTLFVYGRRFDLLDPRTYAWLQELVETVVARTVRRTERYRDDFALIEADPRGSVPFAATGPAAAPVPPPAAPAAPGDSVFAIGGDGPPQTADNVVASGGRRLRSRRWGLWSIVGLLLVAYWIYDAIVAPMFGLPHLEQ